MSLLAAIGLALAAFAIAAFVMQVPRALWTSLLAALVLGLAGYAYQGSPDFVSAPRAAQAEESETGWQLVEARKEMIGEGEGSRDNMLIFADGLTRKGQFVNASVILEGVVEDNPRDHEAWLALGNVLVEHASGALTPAAMHAYAKAEEARPGSVGPGYFVGLAMIRQGAFVEAHQTWSGTLDRAAEDAAGREALAERLGRLEELMRQAIDMAPTGTE